MNTENNHINYTAADIHKYLGGKMSAAEMHAFEKATLEDPFLAEALEGYENVEAEKWQPQLLKLKEEFAGGEKAKVVYMKPTTNRWWKTAAAVLLIGSGAALTYTLTKNNNNEPSSGEVVVAQNDNPTQKTVIPVSPDSTLGLATESKTKVVAIKEKNSIAAEGNYTTITPSKVVSDDFVVVTPSVKPVSAERKDIASKTNNDDANKQVETKATAAESITINSAPANTKFNNTVIPNPGVVTYDAKEKDDVKMRNNGADNNLSQNGRAEQQLNRNFMAQVVGPDNSPLPFANVSIKSEDFGTYADVKGNFRLISTDSVLNVEVKSAGYEPQYYTLRSNNTQNRIVLNEQINAVGYSNNKAAAKKEAPTNTVRRSRLLRDSVENVEPADGWDNYDTYVSNNIEVPDDVIKKNVHGEVEISFDVSKSGAISNLKIDKSLCGDCDEAAKKLIEQGPRWKLKGGKKGKAKVKVQF